jgi:hypothetical protein
LVDDLNVEIAQAGIDFVDILGGYDVVAQRLVDIVRREIAAFVGQVDELLDFLREIDA